MLNQIRELVTHLNSHRYKQIQYYPLRKYPVLLRSLINEAALLVRILKRKNIIFSVSVNPEFYNIFQDRSLRSLRGCFFLNQSFPLQVWRRLFSEGYVEAWLKNGLLIQTMQDKWQFVFRIVPYENFVLITSRFDRTDQRFTFLSFDSLYLASFLRKRFKELGLSFKNGLDLCCGAGIQSFVISSFCQNVAGWDISSHAIEFARINATLNGLSRCTFEKRGFSNGFKDKFDILVANPPFMFLPEGDNTTDSNGGAPFGLGITFEILKALPRLLKNEGRAFILTRSPVIKKIDYLLDQLPSWLLQEYGYWYHYISDSIVPIQAFEDVWGIKKYRYVVLEVFRGSSRQIINYSFWHRQTNIF